MTIATSQIVKHYRKFFSQLKIYVTIPMCCTSKVTNYVTMISNFSSSLSISFLQSNNRYFVEINVVLFHSWTILLKAFVHYFFAIFILLKNCLNKFISCIFTSVNNSLLSKPIINFISKITRNVILIFLCVRTFIIFNTP